MPAFAVYFVKLPSIVEQIKLADATPVVVRTSAADGFTLHAQPLIDAITPKTKGFIINSPANPTGALITEGELTKLAQAAKAKGLWIVLDLCYEQLIYEPVPANLPGVLFREMRERAIVCGSASKGYAMTGWRCGWTVGPKEVIAACGALQSHQTSNVSSITQKAVLAALTGPQDCVTAMLNEYRSRRDQVWSWLTADPRIKCVKPAGAFYLFIDITELMAATGIATSAEFADKLIEESYVVTTAGEAFDAPGFLRISYANSLERLKEACDRLSAFVKKYEAVGAGR
jgi:aspartate aminotransferase